MFGSGMKWLPLASYKNDEEEERRRKALTTQTAGRPSLTSHVPILKQLEDMLIQKISPQRAEPQTHVVRPGDTLWGMAEQHLPGGGSQWPDIRDLNIQTLQEGLERFPKDDPRRKKELGHWIFPGQEFQLPMPGREPEPEPEPEPTGLMEEIRRLIENPPKRFSEGDPVMAKGRETLPEAPASPTVRLEGDEGIKHPLSIESIEQDPFFKMGGAVVEDIKRRADEAKAPPKTAGKDTDMLVEQYLEWNFGRKGKSPTEEDVATAIRKVTEYPEMYRKGFANEAPKTAAGKVGSFISRMSEAGANAFTLTEGDMPMDTTGNAAADGIAETAGNLMGLLSPEGPVQAIFGYMGQVFWGIAPKLATILKVPVNLVQRSLTASGGMAVLGGYTTESFKETPKEMGKGAVVGAFMGVAEHIAGPVMNAVSKRFGVPVGSKAEMALEVIHTQGTSMSALSAGYGILEGKSAKEVARDAVTGYALGALLGGLSVGYNEARFRMQGKGFTMKGQKGQDINKVIKKMMEDGWVQVRPGVFEHPNQPPGYHRTLEVEYKGETISLSRLMRQHGGEIPKGTIFPEGAGAPGVPAETPRRISGLIGEGGEVTPRTTEVTPTAPATAAVTEGKMPQAARDLVVRTKNPLKKEYGRGIITWLEGGKKPSIPEGLSEAEAQDIETKLVKMAEREGMAPAETTPVTPEPTETEAAPPPEGEPAGAEKQIQDWLDSVTADYPAESKKSVQEGIMRFIAENNDTVRKQGLEAVPRLAAEAGYIEKAPVVEVAPKEPEKPPESAKEPWLMTRDEFLQEKLNKYPNAPKMQMEAWESQYDTALADSPRDADIPLHVFDTLNPELQRHLMKYNSKLEKAVLEREAKKGLEGDKKKPAPGAKVPDQVRLGRFITHKGTEGIAYKDDRGGYRMKFEGSDIEYNYSLNFVKEWIEEPGDKKGLGEDKEKKPASKPKSLTISDYGLHIEKTKTARGNPVWEVSGNTHQHKDALKKAGGKWYGAKRVWSFYGDNDPTGTLLDVLAGKEVKISDVDTGEAGITETTGSGKITGLDSRIPIQQAEKAHYGQFLITRGGIPSDAQKGPGNDPAISKILRPHQVDGVNMAVAAIDQYGGFILADGTGAGKTMQIVATMNHYAKHGEKVLVVVPNRTIINDAYRRDAEMLGIEYNEVKNGVLESGKINITTYASLNKVREAPDYVAFDESHSLKNVDAARSKLGRRMAINAKGALFASATPFDKGEHLPYLEKTGIFSMKSHDQVMVSLGYKKDTIKVKTSYGERQVTVWKPDASLESRVKRMDMLFDEIADLGIMVKREVSMDKVAVGYWNISLPAEAHVKMNEIEDFYLNKYEVGDVSQLFPLAKAQMLMAQRRFQEHYKVADVYALAKSEIDAGRQVIIFATRTSPSHLKEQVYATMGGKRVLVDEFIVDTSPPTLPDIAEMFEKEGFKCSKIYGSGNVDSEVAKFQKGETRIALATPEKGGAGLSLDDTVGDSPRTMIVMTPLFSGTDNVQLPGRINRMSTKSPSRVVYVLADTAIDEWNKGIITEKMKTLNAVVRGDISKLDLDDMDRDVGAEALPEPERIGRDVAFSKDATYSGIKEFEATIDLPDGKARLIIRQSAKGAKTWNIYHEYYSGGVSEGKRDLLAQDLSRKEVKEKARELLATATDVSPGGKITFGEQGTNPKVPKAKAKKPTPEAKAPSTEPIAGYTEITMMDTKTTEEITLRREYRIHEPSQDTIADLIKAGTEEGKAKKPYHVQQRVLKDSKVEEDWKLMSSFGELKDAREYVAGVDNIVAVDSDVAELTKKEAPKEKVEPLKPFKPIAKGNKDFAFTETENIKIEFEYCLTEADDVVTSFKDIHAPKPNPAYYQDEPGLQPRNIERKATEHRINDFVAKLEPLRMGENIEISKGAPTVGADGRVEIGNHRTWALITAYKKDLPLAGEYREWLTNNAEKFGISKSDVEGAKEPILVRLRLTEIDRAALAKKGNVPGEQKMSAAEVAELDALEIDDGLMATFVPHDEGRVETRANKPFISKFIGEVVPSSERNDMMAKDGSGLTVDGVKRIKNAILAKVYGNTNALIKLMEESTPNVRNIMNAMNAIAPRLMLQKHEMEKGNLFPLDLSENLSRAMLKLSELRDSKMTVKEYFDARQLFGVELTNLEKDILAILDENKFSAKRIGMIFKEYMDGVEKLGNPKQLSILSKTPPTRAELLDTSVELAKEKWELTKSEKQEKAGQSTLFQDQEVDGEGTTEKDKGAEKGSDDDPESISYQLKREAETTVVKPAPDNYTPPKNTVMAYKLCQTNPDHPGKVFPLYVEAENEFPIGKWSIGEFVHIKKGKQKDMDLTYRPGLHALWKPDSKHIQMEGKVRTKVGNRVRLVKAPRVWARVELSADVNWQKLAETTRTKDIRAMIPRGGYYLWKRPPRQGGYWYIAGEMKVHKVLSDAEVNDIMSKITDKDFPSIEAARAQSIAPNPERVGIVNLANASWDNPHLSPKEVQYVYTEEKRIEYLDRKELDKRGYHHLPEGRYQVTGLTEVLPGEPRKVLLYPGASKDTLLEENTHVLYDKLNEIDPELKKDILGWEEAVAAKAAKLGMPIPGKGELFAKAFTFAEMGYAKEEPELANLLSIPKSITDRFLKILGASKKGINNAELWRGRDMPGVSPEDRALHVDMSEITKGEITATNISSRAYQIKRIKPKILENEKAVSALMEIADELSLLPSEKKKVPAYRNAAINLAKQDKPISELIKNDDLRKIPGIGPSINAKLEELNKTGKIDYLNELKEKSFTEEVISLAHDYQRMAGGDVKDHLKSAQKALNPGKVKMSKQQGKVAKNNHKRAELEIKNIERRIEQGYRPIYESEMLANAGLPVTPESRRNMVGYLWHDDMFIPKPKEADQWSKQDMTALEKAPNILDKWVRPLYRTLIREMTNEGTISKKQIHVYVNKYISIIDKATKGFTRAEISRTSAMLEGLMKAEGKEGEAAKTIREQFFDPLFKEAVDAGILKPGQYVEDYYSHIVENVKKISGDSIDMGKAWFTHERTGDLKDYNRDVREVAYIYVNAMAKRLFVEPVIQKWKPAMMEMHPDRRKMAEDFFQEILGRPLGEERLLNQLIADMYALTGKDLTGRPAQEVSRFIVSLFAQDKMGLSMVAAIRNHTQKLLAIVDVDPIRGFGYAAKAQKWLLTRGGQDFVNKYCTLLNQRIYYEGLQEIAYYHSNLNKLMDKTSKLTMSFFRWADLNNVKISFLIGYFGGLRKGMSVAEAIDFGNDVALRTQYPYDVRRAPLYRGPIGKTIGLFTSWSGHFLELQADWINQRSFHKILLAALYLAGAEYLARKFGLVIRAGVTDIIKGHILYKAAKGEPGVLRSYINDFKKVANRLRSGDPEEWKRAVIEFTYLMPAGVFWKRLHRFVEAAGDNWIVRRDDGTILYEFSKDDWLSQKTGIPKEAVLSLLGQTTENAERWEYSGKLDKALQAIADPSVTDVVFMRDPDAAVAKLKEDAQRLNLNYAEELGKSKGRLRVKYYDKLYEAHSKGNKDKTKEIEAILWELGAKPSDVWKALRNRYEKRK